MKILTQTLAIVLFTFSLVSCSKEKDTPVNSIKDVLINLAPDPKTFEINPAEETMLHGDKGTAVYVPADAFQFEDGTTPTGKVNIELKECYSLADMIGENLHTTSQGRILQTAGMIYFNATADGKQLSLRDDKAFVIGFPKNNQDEMDLFYDFAYNDTVSTWVLDYKTFEMETTETVVTTKTQQGNGDINVAQIDSVSSEGDDSAVYPIEMTPDLYDYGFTIYLWSGSINEMLLLGRNNTIRNYIENPASTDNVGAREFLENDWRVGVEFDIDKNGVMTNFRVIDGEFLYANYNDRAVRIAIDLLKSAPPFDLSSNVDKADHDWSYQLGISGTRRINWDRFKAKFRAQFSQYKDKAIQQLDKTALDYYLFSATKMGWINCDRFWDIDEDEKMDFIVTAPKDTKTQIIFKDIKSIMTGTYKDGQLVFSGVPLGKQIKIIGISYANGKPTMGVAETTIDKDGFVLIGFQEFSLDDLEMELNKMN